MRAFDRVRPQGARRTRGRPRRTLLATLVGLALGSGAAGPAFADSGNGVDTALGNALNPGGVTRARDKDPDGLGEAQHSRSPTGLMTAEPYLLRDEPTPNASGWVYTGLIEFGGLHIDGDRDAGKYLEYKSLKSGAYLNNFVLQADQPADAYFVDSTAGALGRDDQYFGLSTGRYNAWKLKVFYNETNHVYTSRYRNLWNGTGSDTLTLANLPAGPIAPATAATTDTAIGAAALATPYSSLAVKRRKGGVRFDMNLGDQWKVFASYSNEKRAGARPFGMVMGGGGGTGGVEIPESIDYDTHDFLAGFQWNNERTSANLQASASLFRNNIDTLSVDNPMFLAAANGITNFPRAVFDLYPDNDQYNLKAELAHAMPEFYGARFTGTVSATRSRQNDALIPSTAYAGATVNGIAGGAWNTLDSLSQPSAKARIDTRLIDLGAALTPTAGLDLKAKLRHYATSNDTEYWACNPLTGQWGRLINDGSGAVFAVPNTTAGNNAAGTPATAYDAARCDIEAVRALGLVPSAGNVNIRNIPYEYRQTNASIGADYRFARSQNLSAYYEREDYHRAYRERAETWEDRLKLGYVNRALAGGTVRASLDYGRRRGSTYVADPYDAFFSASFGPLPTATGTNMTSWIHINDLHRKFDLADRDQTTLNLRWNTALREDLDLSLNLQAKDQRYPSSSYGRNGHQRQNTINADLSWQPAPDLNVYGYLSQQEARLTQAGLQQNACVLGSTYYFYSDGSVSTTGTPTAAQVAAGITVVGNSGVVTAANFLSLCGTASPTSPLYPTSRAWTATQNDSTTALGFGIRRDFTRFKVDLNYGYTRSRTNIGYTFNAAALGLVTSGAPTAAQQTALALIGAGMPDLVFRQDVIDANVLIPLRKDTVLRVLLRHEIGKFRDWHYDGVADNPTPSNNQQTYLDSGPQNYETTAVGVLLQLAW